MTAHRHGLGLQGRLGRDLSPAEQGDDLAQKPRLPGCAATDHHAVRARGRQRRPNIAEAYDIAVDDHRRRNRALDRGDERPVGGPVVWLAPRAAVDGDHLDTAIFGDRRRLRVVSSQPVRIFNFT